MLPIVLKRTRFSMNDFLFSRIAAESRAISASTSSLGLFQFSDENA